MRLIAVLLASLFLTSCVGGLKGISIKRNKEKKNNISIDKKDHNNYKTCMEVYLPDTYVDGKRLQSSIIPNPLPQGVYTYAFIDPTPENLKRREWIKRCKDILNDSLITQQILIDDYLQSDIPISLKDGQGSYSHLGDNIYNPHFDDKNNEIQNYGWDEYYPEFVNNKRDECRVPHHEDQHLFLAEYHGHQNNTDSTGMFYNYEAILSDNPSWTIEDVKKTYYHREDNYFTYTYENSDLSNYWVNPDWVFNPERAAKYKTQLSKREWEKFYNIHGKKHLETHCEYEINEIVHYEFSNMIVVGEIVDIVKIDGICRYVILFKNGYKTVSNGKKMSKSNPVKF